MLEIYAITCLSFALMYTYVYGLQVVYVVNRTLDNLDLTNKWSPIIYLIDTFVASVIFMPIFSIAMLTNTKWGLIKHCSTYILRKKLGLKDYE